MREVRKEDGSKYPPSSLHVQLTGLLRHMRSSDPGCLNILDMFYFVGCILLLMPLFEICGEEGIGAEEKHASVITKQEENFLWEKGILGTTKSLLSLLRAVFSTTEEIST